MSFRMRNVIDKDSNKDKPHDPLPKSDHLTKSIEGKHYYNQIRGTILNYEPTEIVYDKISKTWKIVNSEEAFNYT